jgi:CHAD domain-containing protein
MTVSPTLAPLLTRRTRLLFRHLPAAVEGDPTALHRARVASRRLRELLPLAPSGSGKARKRVRRLTRLLGGVRELDVALALLDSPEMTEAAPRLALFDAGQHLTRQRDACREAMLRRLHKLNLKKLERRLTRFVDEAAATESTAWRRLLAARLTRRAARLRDATAEAGAIYVPERLHGVRIAAKQLRYTLEIAAEAGVRGAASLAASVRRTQVTLGALQDRTVLLREVQDAAAQAADPVTRQGLFTLAATLEQRARELHARYLSQREDLAQALAAVRRETVPAIAGSGRTRAPLKASLKSSRRSATGRAAAR